MAIQLLMLLAAIGALAWRSGAGADTVAASTARLAPLSRIAAIYLHVCDEVVPGHGLEVDLFLLVAQVSEGGKKLLHAVYP